MTQESLAHPTWFQLPRTLGISENLSQQVEHWGLTVSPFDDDPFYDGIFYEMGRLLHHSSPRHVLLIRDKGVSDHAVLMELARKCQSGSFPHLKVVQFLSYDCRFLAPEECRPVLEGLQQSLTVDQPVVLCLDSIASLLKHNAIQMRSLLLRFLKRAPCRVIGVLSSQEYEELFAGRPDMSEFFSDMELPEPPHDSACRVVSHFSKGLEQQYQVSIDEAAIEKSVTLSSSFIPSSRLPAKAVKVLRDICENKAFEKSMGTDEQSIVDENAVIERIAAVSGVPATTISGLPDGIDYFEALRSRILGQDEVVEQVATELSLIRAGMVDSGKPASVMLFVGQTGTGKTELAKVLAQLYSASKRLKTFTLGNFSEAHSVSGIIGVPPGYVGHDQGGRLVNELNSDPYSVFLLDEADKAHPDVMQPFLNLFDEGWMIDQQGTKAFAERAIFILTTNVGQRQIMEMQKKGKPWDEIHAKLMDSLSQIRHAKANRPVFTPEFLARIKRVVIFRPLDAQAMEQITQQLCNDLIAQWKVKRKKALVIEPCVQLLIAQKAHKQNDDSKGKEGGRIVRKLIANLIEAKLQQAIATDSSTYLSSQLVTVFGAGAEDDLSIKVRFA